MAEVVIASVLEKLAGILSEKVGEVQTVRGQIEQVQNELFLIEALLKDVNFKCKRNNVVTEWLNQVRKIALRIATVIDTIMNNIEENRALSSNPFIRIIMVVKRKFKAYMYGEHDKLEKIIVELERLYRRRSDLRIEDLGAIDDVDDPEPYDDVVDPEVVGLEDDQAKIIEQLLDNSILMRTVLSIVGTGGLGKKTLAQKVYNILKKGSGTSVDRSGSYWNEKCTWEGPFWDEPNKRPRRVNERQAFNGKVIDERRVEEGRSGSYYNEKRTRKEPFWDEPNKRPRRVPLPVPPGDMLVLDDACHEHVQWPKSHIILDQTQRDDANNPDEALSPVRGDKEIVVEADAPIDVLVDRTGLTEEEISRLPTELRDLHDCLIKAPKGMTEVIIPVNPGMLLHEGRDVVLPFKEFKDFLHASSSDKWLDVGVVTIFLMFLIRRCAETCVKSKVNSCAFLDPGKLNATTVEFYGDASVQYMCSAMHQACADYKKFILLSYHQLGHWCLIVIVPIKNLVLIMDSSQPKGNISPR